MKKTIITSLAVFVIGIISFVTQVGSARASVISTTPTANAPFVSAMGTNSKLYIAGYGCNCLYVHDVSDKSHPTILATTTTSSEPGFVVFNNDYLYVGTYRGVIDIFNVANPSAPIKVGQYVFPNGYGTSKMRIMNNKLFVSFYQNGFVGPGGVKILSLTNPAVLTDVSTITFTANQSGGGDVLPIGNYLYVADYFGLTLRTYDISNITAPMLKQLISNVTEPLDYAKFEPWRLLSRGDALYVIDDNIIQIYDISNPSVMWYTSTTVAFKDGEGVDIVGGILYFSSSFDHTVAWYNITDPFNPRLIDSIVTGQNNYWMSIDADGYVYINSTSDNTVNIYPYIRQSRAQIEIPVRTPVFSDQCRAALGYTCSPVYYYYDPFVSNTTRGTVSTTPEATPVAPVVPGKITTATTTAPNTHRVIKVEPRKPQPIRIDLRRTR